MVLRFPCIIVLFLITLCYADESLNNPELVCYECNVMQRSSVKQERLKPCQANETLKVSNCVACAKFVTYMTYDYRKPRWGQDFQKNEVVSRFCLKNFEPRWPNQCVKNFGSGSEQTRCFCTGSLCNGAFRVRSVESVHSFFMAALVLLFKLAFE